MSLPEPLDRRWTDRLIDAPNVPTSNSDAKPSLRARLRSIVSRVAQRSVRPVVLPLIEPTVSASRAVAEQAMREVTSLEHTVSSLHEASLRGDLDRGDLDAVSINQELLKGEMRKMEADLHDLVGGLAGDEGLGGVADRMAELRERITAVERRIRSLASRRPVETESNSAEPNAEPSSLDGDHDSPSSSLFDYVGFERRFRGEPIAIAQQLGARYGELLVTNSPVLDLGCGRGELLELLKKEGVEAVGVDTDPSMVMDAQERGLDVREVDAVTFLRQASPGAFGSIIATHLAEHLQLDELLEMLQLAATRLRGGGVMIMETPNPASLIVLGNSYILDPTHVRPLHPKLLEFLCEGAGFRSVESLFFAPATTYHLHPVDDPGAPTWVKQINAAFAQLNETLFGPQDYAIVATAPPSAPEIIDD